VGGVCGREDRALATALEKTGGFVFGGRAYLILFSAGSAPQPRVILHPCCLL